jgi:negative regulator of flagellin synthesis FlgM
MGIEINGNGRRPPPEAVEAGKSQAGAQRNASASAKSGARSAPAGSDQLQLSGKAAQLQALEAEIANLPVVDTQRVQDVQRTLATGNFEIVPARVAAKLLTFESGLGQAQ